MGSRIRGETARILNHSIDGGVNVRINPSGYHSKDCTTQSAGLRLSGDEYLSPQASANICPNTRCWRLRPIAQHNLLEYRTVVISLSDSDVQRRYPQTRRATWRRNRDRDGVRQNHPEQMVSPLAYIDRVDRAGLHPWIVRKPTDQLRNTRFRSVLSFLCYA